MTLLPLLHRQLSERRHEDRIEDVDLLDLGLSEERERGGRQLLADRASAGRCRTRRCRSSAKLWMSPT